MLAPLFDGMIARDISKRFTAPAALQFFQDLYPSVTPRQLSLYTPRAPHWELEGEPERYDRWKDLPADFVQTWSKYRLPKLPQMTRYVRMICQHHSGYKLVQGVRKAGRVLMYTVWLGVHYFRNQC
jgi:hypothetical protein